MCYSFTILSVCAVVLMTIMTILVPCTMECQYQSRKLDGVLTFVLSFPCFTILKMLAYKVGQFIGLPLYCCL